MKFLVASLSALLICFSSGTTLAADKDMNFRFNPVGLLIGAVNVNFDIAVAEQWTLGPELVYWNFDSDSVGLSSGFDVTAFGLGARANWYKNGVHETGLYVGPSVNFVKVTADYSEPGYSSTGEASGIYAGAVVGYAWFWSSFNILLGGGFVASLGDTEAEATDSNGNKVTQSSRDGGFALEFSLGWTF